MIWIPEPTIPGAPGMAGMCRFPNQKTKHSSLSQIPADRSTTSHKLQATTSTTSTLEFEIETGPDPAKIKTVDYAANSSIA